METTLLTLGILLVLVGLIGQVKAKEIEVGTKNPLVRIILGLLGVAFIYLALSKGYLPGVPAAPAAQPPASVPASPIPVAATSVSAPAGGSLFVNIVVVPQSVTIGERAAIYVTVSDQANNNVEGARVLVEAGGGKFLEAADTSYDPNGNLQGPFSAAGYTSLNGVYTTWWVCNPCAAAYGLNVKALKDGYTDARGDVTINIK